MSRTSALEDGFPCGTREDWLNAEHVHIKLTAHSANVPAEFTWHPPEPCASLHSLPRAGPSLREPLPEIDEREHVIWTYFQRLFEFCNRTSELFCAVVIQTQKVMDGNGVLLCAECRFQFFDGFRVPAMLAVIDCLRDGLVHLDAILGIGQLTVADCRVLSRGEGRVSQGAEPLGQLRIQGGLLGHLLFRGEA